MEKLRFIRIYFCLSLFLIAFLTKGLWAQSAAELYRNHQIIELEKLYKNDTIASPDWKLFVDALFEADGEEAINKMIRAYSQSEDQYLRSVIRVRIAQFYSARGYYETSRRALNDEKFFSRIVSVKQKSSEMTSTDNEGNNQQKYGVQMGAFSSYENAQQLQKKYQEKFSNTVIIEKTKNGQTLYVVVIGGYENREKADATLELIKQSFYDNGYIIQY